MATRGPGMPGSRHPTRHVIPSTNTTPPRHRLIYSYNSLQFLSLCCHGNRQTYLTLYQRDTGLSTVITGPGLLQSLSLCYYGNRLIYLILYQLEGVAIQRNLTRLSTATTVLITLLFLISLSWKPPDTTYISKTVQYYGVPPFHSRAKECYVYYYLALVLQA